MSTSTKEKATSVLPRSDREKACFLYGKRVGRQELLKLIQEVLGIDDLIEKAVFQS